MKKEGYISIIATDELGLYADSPSSFVHTWSGSVRFHPDEGAVQDIGLFEVIYIDVDGAMNQRVRVVDVFDCYQNTFDYLKLYDDDYDFNPRVCNAAKLDGGAWSPSLLILDRLIIEPEYRGNGIGLKVLSALMLRFSTGAGLIALKPYPLQLEYSFLQADKAAERKRLGFDELPQDKRTATSKLKKYYAKLGFRPVPRTDFMVLNPSNQIR